MANPSDRPRKAQRRPKWRPGGSSNVMLADLAEAHLVARGRWEAAQNSIIDALAGPDRPWADSVDEQVAALVRERFQADWLAEAASRQIAKLVLRIFDIDGSSPWESVAIQCGIPPFCYTVAVDAGLVVEPFAIGRSWRVQDARVIVVPDKLNLDIRTQPTPETDEDSPDEEAQD
jgi:hypothetical protein